MELEKKELVENKTYGSGEAKTPPPSPGEKTQEQELSRLYQDMQDYSLTPLWQIETNLMARQPQPEAVAWLWKWQNLYDIAQRSGELVPIHRGGDRRAIALSNPGL